MKVAKLHSMQGWRWDHQATGSHQFQATLESSTLQEVLYQSCLLLNFLLLLSRAEIASLLCLSHCLCEVCGVVGLCDFPWLLAARMPYPPTCNNQTLSACDPPPSAPATIIGVFVTPHAAIHHASGFHWLPTNWPLPPHSSESDLTLLSLSIW